jgi:hypothetical protein
LEARQWADSSHAGQRALPAAQDFACLALRALPWIDDIVDTHLANQLQQLDHTRGCLPVTPSAVRALCKKSKQNTKVLATVGIDSLHVWYDSLECATCGRANVLIACDSPRAQGSRRTRGVRAQTCPFMPDSPSEQRPAWASTCSAWYSYHVYRRGPAERQQRRH